jgi:hypothetical protein
MRPDLTERLLRLTSAELELMQDLYQARFVTSDQALALAGIAGGSLGALAQAGLVRQVEIDAGTVLYLTQTGRRAALALLGSEAASGQRAYAALRLAHEIRRSELYLALRQAGMPPLAYRAEPRLGYRSAAGLGERTLVPDALVRTWQGEALIEVDRGTEGPGQLRHKWLRYREWQEVTSERRLYILADAPERIGAGLAAAGLRPQVRADAMELARLIWSRGSEQP